MAPGSNSDVSFDDEGAPSFSVNEDASVYYGDDYWNDLPAVLAWLNQKVSGRPDHYWAQQFRESAGRAFKRALILNCGNGNVEHGLFHHDVMQESIGIDYSDDLLVEARREAAARGIPARYEQLDINTAAFPDDDFDLVVNHAAAHHIARIDKVFRELCRRLPEDGCFVSHDYVGPHRNQYPWDAWDAAATCNRALPERFRQQLHYPHLPTMLEMDPTEAIHSELILETMRRYFVIDELVPLGGAVAYQLLTHNRQIFAADPDDPERIAVIERILAADEAFLAAHPDQTWFAYVVARPNKAALEDRAQLERWTEEEDTREAAALENGGEYYEHTTLQELTLETEHWQSTAHRVQAWADTVKARDDRLLSLPPFRQVRWAASTKAGERLQEERRKRRG